MIIRNHCWARRILPVALAGLLLSVPVFAQTAKGGAEPSAQKPVMLVDDSGYPSGNDTAEGAAIALAQAFIAKDATWFRAVCIAPFGSGDNRKEYERFLDEVSASMVVEAGKPQLSPAGPKSIGKLFAMRHLSLSGPASYGYASFGMRDVAFVDVGVRLQNDSRSLTRTLVIRAADGRWYVHPAPHTAPLLSQGLNDESPSVIDFRDAYLIRQK